MAAPNVLQPYIYNYTVKITDAMSWTLNLETYTPEYLIGKDLGYLDSDKTFILIKPNDEQSVISYNNLGIVPTTPATGGLLLSANTFNQSTLALNPLNLSIKIIIDTNQ